MEVKRVLADVRVARIKVALRMISYIANTPGHSAFLASRGCLVGLAFDACTRVVSCFAITRMIKIGT